MCERSEDPTQLGAQLEIGPASAPCEELGLLSLLEEDALMSLVYSQMFASLDDNAAEKAAVKAAAETARLLRQSESEARTKTVAEARARAEAAAARMLRAAALVRVAAEESAVRAMAIQIRQAQEGRAQEAERLAAEARAMAQAQVEAAEVARLGAETHQRAEEQRATTAATARAQAAAEAKQAEEARLLAEEVEAVTRAVVEAEARAERLTRKFAHEAAKAADEGLAREYATSEQRLWLNRELLAYKSQSSVSDTDSGGITDDTDDYSYRCRLSGSRHSPPTLAAAEGASPSKGASAIARRLAQFQRARWSLSRAAGPLPRWRACVEP